MKKFSIKGIRKFLELKLKNSIKITTYRAYINRNFFDFIYNTQIYTKPISFFKFQNYSEVKFLCYF